MKQARSENRIREILSRLARLEKAIFGGEKKGDISKPQPTNYSGATGGVRFLISKGLFRKKLALGEVRAALSDYDYHYSKQAVHEALKGLARKNGPLVVLKEGGSNFYVNRK